jgi:hypothetical protein
MEKLVSRVPIQGNLLEALKMLAFWALASVDFAMAVRP